MPLLLCARVLFFAGCCSFSSPPPSYFAASPLHPLGLLGVGWVGDGRQLSTTPSSVEGGGVALADISRLTLVGGALFMASLSFHFLCECQGNFGEPRGAPEVQELS